MTATRYEEVNSPKSHGKNNCCLKFWLAFFMLATIALISAVLWLCLAPKYTDNLDTQTIETANGTATLQAASIKRRPGLCALPPAQGPCKATIERYYYDATSGECKKFLYGGCSGNANNFLTNQLCMETCALPSEKAMHLKPEYCLLERDQGPCFAALVRYAYDKSIDQCVEFAFGGCGGNENNFKTLEECETKCMGSKVESGVSSTNNLMARPATSSDVLDAVCSLPKEVGPCRAMMKRWYYDASSGRCVEFVYGGCKGNANNFESREDCEARCGVSKVESGVHSGGSDADTTALCHLPQDRGNCLALIQRWAFDANSGQCVQFTYGGCGGNANNFETKEACEEQCLASIPMPIPATGSGVVDAVCSLPKEVGPCRAMLKRWYYDASSGRCVEFVYGGCRGNANNFLSEADCYMRCMNATLVHPN